MVLKTMGSESINGFMENMYGNVILQDKENIWELFLSKYFIPNI
jgi:hypothetical protein